MAVDNYSGKLIKSEVAFGGDGVLGMDVVVVVSFSKLYM